MNAWEDAILRTYELHSGCADNQEIYEDVGKFMPLTQEHLRPTVHGGRPSGPVRRSETDKTRTLLSHGEGKKPVHAASFCFGDG